MKFKKVCLLILILSMVASTLQNCTPTGKVSPVTALSENESVQMNLLEYFTTNSQVLDASTNLFATTLPSEFQNKDTLQPIVNFKNQVLNMGQNIDSSTSVLKFQKDYFNQRVVDLYSILTTNKDLSGVAQIQIFTIFNPTPVIVSFDATTICYDSIFVTDDQILVDCNKNGKNIIYQVTPSTKAIVTLLTTDVLILQDPKTISRQFDLYKPKETVNYIVRSQLGDKGFIEVFKMNNVNSKIVLLSLEPIDYSKLAISKDQWTVTQVQIAGNYIYLQNSKLQQIMKIFTLYPIKTSVIGIYKSDDTIKNFVVRTDGIDTYAYIAENTMVKAIQWTFDQYYGLTTKKVGLYDAADTVQTMDFGYYFILLKVYKKSSNSIQIVSAAIDYDFNTFVGYANGVDLYPYFYYCKKKSYFFLLQKTTHEITLKAYVANLPQAVIQAGPLTSLVNRNVDVVCNAQTTVQFPCTLISANTKEPVQMQAKAVYNQNLKFPHENLFTNPYDVFISPNLAFEFADKNLNQFAKFKNVDTLFESDNFVIDLTIGDQEKKVTLDQIQFIQSYNRPLEGEWLMWIMQLKDDLENLYILGYDINNFVLERKFIGKFNFNEHNIVLNSIAKIDFAGYTMIFTVVNDEHQIYFYNFANRQFYSKWISLSGQRILNFNVVHSQHLFITIQQNDGGYLLYAQVNNANFKDLDAFNTILWKKKAVNLIKQFQPIEIIGHWTNQHIIFIQLSNSVLVYDFYIDFKLDYEITGLATGYYLAVTENHVSVIQGDAITVYNLKNLAKYVKINSFSIGPSIHITDDTFLVSKDAIYLFDKTQNTIKILQPDNSQYNLMNNQIRMKRPVRKIGFRNHYITDFTDLLVFDTTGISLLQHYKKPFIRLTFEDIILPVEFQGLDKAQINFYNSQDKTQNTSRLYYFTYEQMSNLETPCTDLHYAPIDLTKKTAADNPYTVEVELDNLFGGSYANIDLKCAQCGGDADPIQFTQRNQYDRVISTTEVFYSLTNGKKYAYGQMTNKVIRFASPNNQIMDLVQLPYSGDYLCENIAVSDNEDFTVSACYQQNEWIFYVVSYVSTEPFVASTFKAPNNVYINQIDKVIIQGNYIIVVDSQYNGINSINGYAAHVFYLDFSDPSDEAELASYITTVNTKTDQDLKSYLITDIEARITYSEDIITLIFLATGDNMLLIEKILEFKPDTKSYYFWKNVALLDIYEKISKYDDKFKTAKPPLRGIKAFNLITETASMQYYEIILLFDNYDLFQLMISNSIAFDTETFYISYQITYKYQQYGYYLPQNKIEIAYDDKDIAILIPAYIPDDLVNKNPSTSNMLYTVYKRKIDEKITGDDIQTIGIFSAHPMAERTTRFGIAPLIYNSDITINKVTKTIKQISILYVDPIKFYLESMYFNDNAYMTITDVEKVKIKEYSFVLDNQFNQNPSYTFEVLTKFIGVKQDPAATCTFKGTAAELNFDGVTGQYYQFPFYDYFEGENLFFDDDNKHRNFYLTKQISITGSLENYVSYRAAKKYMSNIVGFNDRMNFLINHQEKGNYKVSQYQFKQGLTLSYVTLLNEVEIPYSNYDIQCYDIEVLDDQGDYVAVDCMNIYDQSSLLFVINIPNKKIIETNRVPSYRYNSNANYDGRRLILHINSKGEKNLLRVITSQVVEVFSISKKYKLIELNPLDYTAVCKTYDASTGKCSSRFNFNELYMKEIIAPLFKDYIFILNTFDKTIYQIQPKYGRIQDIPIIQWYKIEEALPLFKINVAYINDEINVFYYHDTRITQLVWNTENIIKKQDFELQQNIQSVKNIQANKRFLIVQYDNNNLGVEASIIDCFEIENFDKMAKVNLVSDQLTSTSIQNHNIGKDTSFIFDDFQNQIVVINNKQINGFLRFIKIQERKLATQLPPTAQALNFQINCESKHFVFDTNDIVANPTYQLNINVKDINEVNLQKTEPATPLTLSAQQDDLVEVAVSDYFKGPNLKYEILDKKLDNTVLMKSNKLKEFSGKYNLYWLGEKIELDFDNIKSIQQFHVPDSQVLVYAITANDDWVYIVKLILRESQADLKLELVTNIFKPEAAIILSNFDSSVNFYVLSTPTHPTKNILHIHSLTDNQYFLKKYSSDIKLVKIVGSYMFVVTNDGTYYANIHHSDFVSLDSFDQIKWDTLAITFVPENVFLNIHRPYYAYLQYNKQITVYSLSAKIDLNSKLDLEDHDKVQIFYDEILLVGPTRISQNHYNSYEWITTLANYPKYGQDITYTGAAVESISNMNLYISDNTNKVYIYRPTIDSSLSNNINKEVVDMLYDVIQMPNEIAYMSSYLPILDKYEALSVVTQVKDGDVTKKTLGVYYIQKKPYLIVDTSKVTATDKGEASVQVQVSSVYDETKIETIDYAMTLVPFEHKKIVVNKDKEPQPIDVTTPSSEINLTDYIDGIITNIQMECEVKEECGKSIKLQNDLFGLTKSIATPNFFNHIIAHNNISYAVSNSQVYQFVDNRVYTQIAMPIADDLTYCTNIAVFKDGAFSVQACQSLNTWSLHFVGYISIEPFYIGTIDTPEIKNGVYQMYVQENNLFVVDAEQNDIDNFNGIHVYSIDLVENYDKGTVATYIKTVQHPVMNNLADVSIIELHHAYMFMYIFRNSDIQYEILKVKNNNILSSMETFSIADAVGSYISTQTSVLSTVKIFNHKLNDDGTVDFSTLVLYENANQFEVILRFDGDYLGVSPANKVKIYEKYGYLKPASNVQITSDDKNQFVVIPYIDALLNEKGMKSQVLLVYKTPLVTGTTNEDVVISPSAGYEINSCRSPSFSVQTRFDGDISVNVIDPSDSKLKTLRAGSKITFFIDEKATIKSTYVNIIASNFANKQTMRIPLKGKTPPTPPYVDDDGGDSKLWVILLSIALVLIAILVIVGVIWYKKKKASQENEQHLIDKDDDVNAVPVITSEE